MTVIRQHQAAAAWSIRKHTRQVAADLLKSGDKELLAAFRRHNYSGHRSVALDDPEFVEASRIVRVLINLADYCVTSQDAGILFGRRIQSKLWPQ